SARAAPRGPRRRTSTHHRLRPAGWLRAHSDSWRLLPAESGKGENGGSCAAGDPAAGDYLAHALRIAGSCNPTRRAGSMPPGCHFPDRRRAAQWDTRSGGRDRPALAGMVAVCTLTEHAHWRAPPRPIPFRPTGRLTPMRQTRLSLLFACLLATGSLRAADAPEFSRSQDVIYGRKYGLALTMDVFTPKKANGVGVIFVVSGGSFPGPQAIHPAFAAPLLKRGYTVFAVVHGSQPKFTVPEIVEDMHRAVRFVRHNAARFKIDPDCLGIYGASAGGHLSLMM